MRSPQRCHVNSRSTVSRAAAPSAARRCGVAEQRAQAARERRRVAAAARARCRRRRRRSPPARARRRSRSPGPRRPSPRCRRRRTPPRSRASPCPGARRRGAAPRRRELAGELDAVADPERGREPLERRRARARPRSPGSGRPAARASACSTSAWRLRADEMGDGRDQRRRQRATPGSGTSVPRWTTRVRARPVLARQPLDPGAVGEHEPRRAEHPLDRGASAGDARGRPQDVAAVDRDDER